MSCCSAPATAKEPTPAVAHDSSMVVSQTPEAVSAAEVETESEPAVESAPTVDPAFDPGTPANAAALRELRAALAAEGCAQDEAGASDPEYVPWVDRLAITIPRASTESRDVDDFTLLRFLIAREMDVAAAAAMVVARVKWACEIGLYGKPSKSAGSGPWPGGLMAEWRPSDGGKKSDRAEIAERVFYAGVGDLLSLKGAPLMLERLGSADLAGVNREGPELLELLLNSYIAYLEDCFHAVTRESARQRRLVRALVLVDATGISASTLWNINVVKSVAAIGPEYYPECSEKVFIVRAPWLITKVFGAVSVLLPERTRQKVEILSGECIEQKWNAPKQVVPQLEQHLTEELLPQFLGGKARTPAGCSAALVPQAVMSQLKGAT